MKRSCTEMVRRTLLAEDTLQDNAVPIFTNKQDIPDRMTVLYLYQKY